MEGYQMAADVDNAAVGGVESPNRPSAALEALTLYHEEQRNVQRIQQLEQELRTMEIDAIANAGAANEHVRTMQNETAVLAVELDRLENSLIQPQVPREKVEEVQLKIKELKLMRNQQETEHALLERVLKAYVEEERIGPQLQELMRELNQSWEGDFFPSLIPPAAL